MATVVNQLSIPLEMGMIQGQRVWDTTHIAAAHFFLSQGGKEGRKNNWYHPVQGSAP